MTALPPRPTHNFDPLRFARPAVTTEQQRRRMIAAAAYLRAERRGFAPGHETQDWIAAETEIDQQIFRAIVGSAW